MKDFTVTIKLTQSDFFYENFIEALKRQQLKCVNGLRAAVGENLYDSDACNCIEHYEAYAEIIDQISIQLEEASEEENELPI